MLNDLINFLKTIQCKFGLFNCVIIKTRITLSSIIYSKTKHLKNEKINYVYGHYYLIRRCIF